jgi:RNA polymerase sigma-70 factor (ECF subfamily)
MGDTAPPDGPPLDQFRDYLMALAKLHLDRRLQGKLEPADIVQQTLLEAHRGQEQFRGATEAERASWLRQILLHNLANSLRDLSRAKRDVHLERSLQVLAEDSSSRLEACLAAEQSSPSEQAERNERAMRLTRALETLPEAQREAVILRHYQGWSLADISRHMDRSAAAVAGLLHRGLERLRFLLDES